MVLGHQLTMLAKQEDSPWPEPVPQYRPLWCCQHQKRWHEPRSAAATPEMAQEICWGCIEHDLSKPAGRWVKPDVEPFHEFAHERNWSVDFAYPALKIAIECDGLGWRTAGGRHTRPAGYERDREKDLTLEARGWTVIRCTQRDITSGLVLSAIETAIKERAAMREGR